MTTETPRTRKTTYKCTLRAPLEFAQVDSNKAKMKKDRDQRGIRGVQIRKRSGRERSQPRFQSSILQEFVSHTTKYVQVSFMLPITTTNMKVVSTCLPTLSWKLSWSPTARTQPTYTTKRYLTTLMIQFLVGYLYLTVDRYIGRYLLLGKLPQTQYLTNYEQ